MNGKTIGGDLIGSGSFGCVFKPALECIGQTKVHDGMVSKVFFSPESKKEADDEIKIDNVIKQIKGNEAWAHIWDKNCLPKKYKNLVKEEPLINTCLDENSIDIDDFDKYRRMLQGTYAGKPFDAIFTSHFKSPVFSTKTKFVNNFLYIMRLMKPLFIGLIEMHKSKVSHNDIKSDNIMVDDDGCKYIDFGLAAKLSNTRFYKQRSMSEFVEDRIYPSYPYEYIYLYATKDVLQDEKEDKEYGIYRGLHDRYQLVHETIFQRQKLKDYLLSLIDRGIKGELVKHKQEIISLIDTYSVGVLVPGLLGKYAKRFKKLNQMKKFIHDNKVKPFIELFKDMSNPDYFNRIKPDEAYRRYLELEKLYLTSSNKAPAKKRTHRRK